MSDGQQTVVGVLQHRAHTGGSRPFIADGARWINYQEMWRLVCRGQHALATRGVRPGDRVLIDSTISPSQFVASYLAAHLNGTISVPLGGTGSAAAAYIADDTEAAFVIARDTYPLLFDRATGLENLDPKLPSPDQTADILYTSGTTGRPKGVMLSHAAIYASTSATNRFIGNGADDYEIVTVPLSHSFGLGRIRGVLMAGGRLSAVSMSPPGEAVTALADPAVTGMSCVPAGIAILQRWGEQELAAASERLRYIELGSSHMSADRKRLLAELLPATRIIMHYGLTEASRSCFLDLHGESDRLTSVGRASPGVQLRIMDQDDSPIAASGEGVIHIHSPAVMSGYWRNPAATARALSQDGWLRTSDVGRLDEQGFLTLVGRLDDQINVGGKKVDPAAVEEAAIACEGVADAGCVGISDPGDLVGQVPVLFIVESEGVNLDLPSLRRHLKARLEGHERPTRILVVRTLPKTETGKLKRAELRLLLSSEQATSN
ncbi:AMP-binding protein [Sphingomonas aerophila]|uniref:Long-chain acyl-CoA synthetase n=1 Tax=Sphingomonas aerophila TaxID=1344948 RepID=A0A7W9BGQ8_9SPHN|nr:long-chain acyl-CoA synthetase [Sphingomonas aerophila]